MYVKCVYQIPILKLEKLPELKGNINRSDDSKQAAKLLDLRKTNQLIYALKMQFIYIFLIHEVFKFPLLHFVSLIACTKQTCFLVLANMQQ